MTVDNIGIIDISFQQRERFRSGELAELWARQYIDLFDEDDLRIARNQPDYHFYEWLAAILIHQATGYLSLVEKYQFIKAHPHQHSILKKIVSPGVLDLLVNSGRVNHVQCPDLFVYLPDFSDYFFCEVKGPKDRIREEQLRFFHELSRVSGKRVRLIRFRLMKR